MPQLVLVCALLGVSLEALADEGTDDNTVRPAVERLSGHIPDEVEAYRDVHERFKLRAEEFERDTRSFVARREAEERRRLTLGYEALISSLSDEEQNQRALAVERFEAFLQSYATSSAANEVRLRLAELYYKRAEEDQQAAATRYFRLLDEATERVAAAEAAKDFAAADAALLELEELESRGDPKADFRRVVALLRDIVTYNVGLPDDEAYELLDYAYYLLAFCYHEDVSAQWDRAEAKATFEELIAARPDSEFADAAHLVLGEYYFEDNDFDSAIPEFQHVVDRGSDGKYYSRALYKLAWGQYKLSNYEVSMALFVELLDKSEQLRRDSGRPSNFAPEAIENLALSIADLSDYDGESPLDIATKYFASLGEQRPYEWDVLVKLAEILVEYARPEDALPIYAHLQSETRFQFRPEGPDFQNEIVRLLMTGYNADPVAAGQARLDLTERYADDSEWARANRNNPEALANARKYIESSLLDVAIELNLRAREANDIQLYAAAADKYREYLDKFPISDGYYENQWYMANALQQAGRIEEATAEYDDLLGTSEFHQFGDGAVVFLTVLSRRAMDAAVGPPNERWAEAPVESTVKKKGEGTREVFGLAPEQQTFIAAVDRLNSRSWGPPTDGVPGADFAEKNGTSALYVTGQVLYYANRFEEARPRLLEVIQRAPESLEASFAASLIVDSYTEENDLAQVRAYTKQFLRMSLGPAGSDDADRRLVFQDQLEKATYLLAQESAKAGEYSDAIEGYLAFVEEFPESPSVPDALLSAAANYDRLGRSLEANDLYERFLREYPSHPEAEQFYFRIAANYEQVFEFEQAIAYYEGLVREFPDNVDAANAVYNAAFLRVGLGDHPGAAAGFERYAKAFPDTLDREETHFRAGEQYEAFDEARAIKFYRGYLKQYGTTSPARAMEAQLRLVKLIAKGGNARTVEREEQALVALFDELVDVGAEVGPRGRDAAAEIAFREIDAEYDRLMGYALSRDEAKDADLLLLMRDEIGAFQTAIKAFNDRYLSFEFITATNYLLADVVRHRSNLGLSIEPPANTPDELLDAYWEALEENLYPEFYAEEDAAIEVFKQVIELGQQYGKHSAWIDEAQSSLNKMRPSDFPAVKQEVLGPVNASQPFEVDYRFAAPAVTASAPSSAEAETGASEASESESSQDNGGAP